MTNEHHSRWSNAAYVLNEVRRPVRTTKIAGPLGLTICGVLYLLANVAYFAAATPAQIKKSGNTVASYFAGAVFGKAAQQAIRCEVTLFDTIFARAYLFISVFVALSAFGNVSGNHSEQNCGRA